MSPHTHAHTTFVRVCGLTHQAAIMHLAQPQGMRTPTRTYSPNVLIENGVSSGVPRPMVLLELSGSSAGGSILDGGGDGGLNHLPSRTGGIEGVGGDEGEGEGVAGGILGGGGGSGGGESGGGGVGGAGGDGGGAGLPHPLALSHPMHWGSLHA